MPGGRELIGLQRWELPQDRFLHRVGTIERQLLDQALRHRGLHRTVGVPLDHDAGRAVLPGELADLLDDESDVRVVELLDFLAVGRASDLLVQVPGIREEVNDDRLGEDLVLLTLHRTGARRRELDVVLVLLAGVFRLGPQLLDDRKVHHLIERRLLGDRVDLLVEEIRGRPGALEAGRVVLVQEEVAVLGVVGRVGVAEHPERVALGNRVARGHQLGDLLLAVLRFQILHRVEDSAGDALDDVRVVLGEIGAREPDVGNELVGGGGRHQQPVAFDLLEVVDIGGPADAPGKALVGVERGRGLEGVLRELEFDFGGLHTGVDQRVEHEEMRRRVLRQHDRLAAQIRHRLDTVPNDNAVAAVGPVDLLIHARHDA